MFEGKIKIFIIFLIILGFHSSLSFAENIKIDLEGFVRTSNKDIYLSDLISEKSLEKLDSDLKKELQKIRLGSAPEFGEVRRFTNYALSEVVRHQASVRSLIRNYSFSIPSEISVERKAKFQLDVIEKEIRNWALKECIDCDVRIHNLKMPLARASQEADWKIVYGEVSPKGFFSIPIEIYENGKQKQKTFVQGELKIFKTVPVLRRSLSPNLKIQSDDIEFKKRDVTYEKNSIPTENEIFGTEVTQYMSADQILWKQNLKRKVALQKGAPVSMIISNPAWHIWAKGIAQENGYVGDLVRIQSLDNKKIVTGLVLVDGTVEVK